MNRLKIQIEAIGLIFCVLAIWGATNKTRFTDIRQEPDFLMTMQVPEISESAAIGVCQMMEEELPESPLILVVTPIDEIEFMFWSGRQKVMVKEVKKEDETGALKTPNAGSEIWIVNPFWYLRMWEKERQYVNLCGVNTMQKGQEYLVFLDERIQGLDGIKVAYRLVNNPAISPIFSLEEKTNVVVQHGEYYMSVPYALLCGNEFFGESEVANQAWSELKEKMMERYVW